MIYVFLSVCCSVIVSILFKMARRYRIDVFQAITWNYSIAMVLTWFMAKPHISDYQSAPIGVYGSLAVLLPALFVIIGLAVKATGIVRTDIAQRLSLFIPIVASFTIFGETAKPLQIVGLAVGILAIICSIPWNKPDDGERKSSSAWLYLLIVFVGFGVIDVLFKQVAAYTAIPFPKALFVIYAASFILSLIVLLIMAAMGKIKSPLRHIGFGWILGIANFSNIFFYLKAHQALSTSPSTVFSAMNIGVITLGAVIGLVVFKEKLSNLNKAGIALAIIAIAIITYAQTH